MPVSLGKSGIEGKEGIPFSLEKGGREERASRHKHELPSQVIPGACLPGGQAGVVRP